MVPSRPRRPLSATQMFSDGQRAGRQGRWPGRGLQPGMQFRLAQVDTRGGNFLDTGEVIW